MQIGKLQVTDVNDSVKNFLLQVDKRNKLLFIIEENGDNEPTLCISLDTLSEDSIKNVVITGGD